MFKSNNRNISKEKEESQPIWFNVSIKPNLKLHKESLGKIGEMGKIGKMVKMVKMVVIEYYI